MIILLGKTCSGKTTIAEQLCKKGYTKLVTYTSRPSRPGETDGVSYHFISREDFEEWLSHGFFAEHTSYQTPSGETWYYGTAMQDVTDDKIAVVNMDGLRVFKNLPGIRPIAFLLHASDETILSRLEARGDDPETAKKRLEKDTQDFQNEDEINDLIDFRIINDNGSSPEEIAEIICFDVRLEGQQI